MTTLKRRIKGPLEPPRPSPTENTGLGTRCADLSAQPGYALSRWSDNCQHCVKSPLRRRVPSKAVTRPQYFPSPRIRFLGNYQFLDPCVHRTIGKRRSARASCIVRQEGYTEHCWECICSNTVEGTCPSVKWAYDVTYYCILVSWYLVYYRPRTKKKEAESDDTYLWS